MPATLNMMKVRAVDGRLLPDPRRQSKSQRAFVGWRECRRDSHSGAYNEEAQHIIPAAPGVKTDEQGRWAGQSSDLFVEGFEVHLTRFVLGKEKKPLVVEVPNNSYFRKAIIDGDIVRVADGE